MHDSRQHDVPGDSMRPALTMIERKRSFSGERIFFRKEPNVKYTLPASLALAAAITLGGCQKKASVPEPAAPAEAKKIQFVPPADSVLTTDQMKKWLQCNPYLDSLSILYKDSFAGTDAARQTRVQEDFVKAQDRICVRVGLPGGYAEYLWALKSASNPKNARVLDSLKLTVYK
jgi:hypothetical protein